MDQIQFLNEQGDFVLHNAHRYPGIYMPLVNESGMMSSVTPWLAGDLKTGQNTFFLAPASMETLHESRASRNFWVRIEGEAPWSVVGQSARQHAARNTAEEEETVLTGGLLWQRLTREHFRAGLKAETLSFVPAGQSRVEIMQVTLTNCGEASLTLTPIAAIPMYGRSADNIRDHRHVTSLLQRVELEPYGVKLSPTLTFDERGHQPGCTVYRVWGSDENGARPETFVPLVRDFIGQGSYDWPDAVINPNSVKKDLLPAGEKAEGGEVIAALIFRPVCLKPGERRQYQVVLAVDDTPAPYLTPAAVEKAFQETREYWQRKALQHFHTGNRQFDAWSRWVAVQPVLRRIYGCSFLPHHDYGRGGRGWRDLWQDSLALLLSEPAFVRPNLVRYFAGVRTDGTNATIIGAMPGEFKADRNNIPRVWMDHGFWPLLTTALYLEETGDDFVLMEEQPYFSDTLAYRGEGAPRQKAAPEQKGTVLEHLLVQTVTAFFDVGEHGHMRLKGADWNDGLDMAGERGESVAFTAAYAYGFGLLEQILKRLEQKGVTRCQVNSSLAELMKYPKEHYGDTVRMREALFDYCHAVEENPRKTEVPVAELARTAAFMGQWIRRHISQTEWTGDKAEQHWFNSYYDNSGRPLEGSMGNKVRMMLTGQVFFLLSGTADEEQARQMIRAADWYLCCPSRGGYCLNTDFEETKLDMGRMFGFAYGHKENGAVFSHMAVMYAYALYSRGFAAEGWHVLELLYEQSSDFSRSKILPGIPEYFDDRGQGMYPYLTGAGSWMILTLQTQVFGVRGHAGNLVLAPRLVADQFNADGVAAIECAFGGMPLKVRYENPGRLDYGQYEIGSVRVNGKYVECSLEADIKAPGVMILMEQLPESREPVEITVLLKACSASACKR